MKTDTKNGYYLIRNTLTGMVYVGSTKFPIKKRWSEHKRHLKRGDHTNKPLQKDWKEYGESSFVFEVIENDFRGKQIETEFIKSYLPKCYNYDFPTTGEYLESIFSFKKQIKTGVIGKIARGEL